MLSLEVDRADGVPGPLTAKSMDALGAVHSRNSAAEALRQEINQSFKCNPKGGQCDVWIDPKAFE